MLTIKSNLKIKDLDTLSKILIKDDIINFALGKVGGGFTTAITDKVAAKLKYRGTTLIINDISLQQTDKLLELGYKLSEITLAFGKWNKDGTVSNDRTVYNIMKAVIKNNIKEKLNIVFLGDIFMGIKHWNSVIANVPYGAIGANIATNIRKTVSYDEFANLLPANDYKRNKEKDLFNYQSEMEALNAGDNFKDAYVTTHLALIHKNKVNNLTLDEFERSQYIDPSLDKYFAITVARKHYAIDSAMYKPTLEAFKNITIEQSIYIGKRDVKSEHLPYSQNSIVTRYNMNKLTKQDVLNESAKSEQALGRVGDFYLIKFNTNVEKTNFATFMYSKNGFKFLCKVFVALNVDSSINMNKFMPKVDWSRGWTVEEILADYGYTKEEIQEVMNDLANFRGMDD